MIKKTPKAKKEKSNLKKKVIPLNPSLVEKILKATSKKDASKAIAPTSETIKDIPEEQDDDEISQEDFTQPTQTERRKRTSPILEETFNTQETMPEATLEESLTGVETRKTDKETKEFYSQTSYETKSGETDHKYGTPVQSSRASQMQQNTGPVTVSDIRQNPFATNITNPDVQAEIKKYSSQNPEERYNVQNLEAIDPTELNPRKKNENPFLQDMDNPTKYEQR